MNLQEFPKDLKNDIEDQSLAILETIKDNIIVIGGWAVRALTGEKHARYTLDIDAISSEDNLKKLKKELENAGLESRHSDWGTQFYQKYKPKMKIIDQEMCEKISKIELRIELSKPKIREFRTHHYFEFSLTDFVTKNIAFHNKDSTIFIRVPPVESMTAVKVGLPVDYKNNFDSAVLLQISDIDKVIEVIKNNDNWH